MVRSCQWQLPLERCSFCCWGSWGEGEGPVESPGPDGMEGPSLLRAQESLTQEVSMPSQSRVSQNPDTNGTDSGFTTEGRTSSESEKDPATSDDSRTPRWKRLSPPPHSGKKLQNDARYSSRGGLPELLRDGDTIGVSDGVEGAMRMETFDAVTEDLSPALENTGCSLDKKPPDSSHLVTFTVTTSFAISKPPTKAEEQTNVSEKGKTKPKQLISSPKAQGYYHMEYFLFPDDAEPIKADVVMFGVVAKLYMEHETKVLKPWYEDDKIWLAWTQQFNLNVTKEFLLKISSHKPMFKMWNTKDKVCSKARFDRPKAFRVGKPAEDTDSTTSYLVLKQIQLSKDSEPGGSFIDLKEVNPPCSRGPAECNKVTELKPLSAGAQLLQKLPPISGFPPLSSVHSKADDIPSLRSISHIGNLPTLPPHSREEKSPDVHQVKGKSDAGKSDQIDLEGTTHKHKSDMGKSEAHKAAALTPGGRGKSPAVKENVLPGVDKKQTKKKANVSKMEKKNSFTMQLSLISLLAGDESVTSCLKEPFPNVLDGYVTLALDAPLLSEEQKHELNPLVIRIKSATCLPNTPIPIQVLKEKCVPVYCRYKFYDQPLHQTHDQEHGTHVYFKDVNVILTETISPGKLREYLQGPPLEIEVHDRDRKIEDFVKKPSLFGDEPEDEKLSNVGLVTSKRTVHNPFTEKDQMWNPYGIAKVSLSDLLHGERFINIIVPIHSCSTPDPIGYQRDSKSGKIMGVLGSVDGPQGSPLPTGHYLESNAILKIRVDIAVPLAPTSEADDCPYGRIILIFENDNKPLLHDLMNTVTHINAKALKLNGYPLYLIQECLPKIRLKAEEKGNSELDVITGFHILDGAIHLFVLEGLKDKAIKQLWEQMPTRSLHSEYGKLEILYNSELSFHQRLYEDLDAILYHIQLHERISSIVQQPLLYVRDMVPPACFQALSRLDYICHATKLREVIQGDLLPSVDMINLLSREFGIPLTKEILFAQKVPLISPSNQIFPAGEENTHWKPSPFHIPLDNYNEKYVQWKREMESSLQDHKDHIQNNINAIFQMQRKFKKPMVHTISVVPADGKPVHNYSCQSLNSSELAKKLLRQKLQKEPKRLFTYSQDYMSATLDPVDLEDELKALITRSKDTWLTPDGFVYPGFKSSIESNQHPRRPDEARVAELTKRWKENILHANILEATLNRDRWRWMHRHLDFDIYRKPSSFFGVSSPISIQLTGDPFKDEQKQAGQMEYSKCDDPKMKTYRCSTEAELATRGLKASDQLSRLMGLLKDKPEKLSLRLPDMILKPIPALAVMQDPEESNTSGFVPGLLDHHSLKWKANMIPRHDMEHAKFKELKGEDFFPYCSKHPFLYKRGIKEMSDEEKKAIFWQQKCEGRPIRPASEKIKQSGSMVETQAISSVLLHIN